MCQDGEGPKTGKAATKHLDREYHCRLMAIEIQTRFPNNYGRRIIYGGSSYQSHKPKRCYLESLYDTDIIYWNRNQHGPANTYAKSICILRLGKEIILTHIEFAL